MGTPESERGTTRRLIASVVLLLACPALMVAFSRWGSVLFPLYRNLSKAWIGLLASLTSMVPFVLWDWLVVALAVVALIVLVRCLRGRGRLLAWLSWVALAASWTLFSFVAGWALNHYAPPLADELGLEVREYSTDELADATEHYLLEAATLAPEVPRNDDGSLAEQDFHELAGIAGASYTGLAKSQPIFSGSTQPVKALLLFGEPLLYSGHTGIFWAPTGESGVPLNDPSADLPFIMCHEAAHRLGLASEQEANFAAYLACEASDDVRLRYSGAYNAFVYCWNALYTADGERAVQLLQDAAEGEAGEGVVLVWADRLATHEAYDAYEGTFEKVGTTVNDTYLKSFGESSGVRSYGLVVDLLIAWQQR